MLWFLRQSRSKKLAQHNLMIFEVLIFLLGLTALSWSADRFVYGSSAIASNYGVSPMIIGLTIVAMGSSAPEIMVAASSSLGGNIDTAVGNAIGSNITNIALVLGCTALLKPLIVSSTTLKREIPIVLVMTILGSALLYNNYLSLYEGILLISLFFIVIGGLTWISIKADKTDPLQSETIDEIPQDVPNTKAIFWVIVGMILLPLSAHFMVNSAVNIAKYLGMSDLVIGLTVIAIGTSLPELAASIAGVLKGEDDLALGNIIGSNIFNILAVLAMPGLIAPGFVDENVAGRDMFIMLGLTLILLIFSFSLKGQRKINRWEGGLLVLSFIIYQAVVLF
jgi:cation:H+ antiporter